METSPTDGLCARVLENGSAIYSCLDCAVDPTCILCADCFRNSGHVAHRYVVGTLTTTDVLPTTTRLLLLLLLLCACVYECVGGWGCLVSARSSFFFNSCLHRRHR